jgi:hypothetical protein
LGARLGAAGIAAAWSLAGAPAAGDDGLVTTAPSARAADSGSSPTPAEVLFREGRALISKHDFAAACPRLEESLRLDPAPGTQFNLARCYELAGRFASAWRAYSAVADAMRAQGQRAREGVARDRIAQVESRLSYVIVRVSSDWNESAVSSAHVTLDGRDLMAAQLGTRIPVDSGEHAIAVTAEGKRAWDTRVHVQADAETLAVEVPRLEDEAPAKAPEPPAEAALARAMPTAALRGEVDAVPVATGPGAQRVAALGLLGAGVVAGGLGAYFGVRAFELGKESRTGCVSNGCWDRPAQQQAQDSHTFGDASTVSFVACALLASAGGVLWLTAPSETSKRTIAIVPGLSPRAALWVQGRF